MKQTHWNIRIYSSKYEDVEITRVSVYSRTYTGHTLEHAIILNRKNPQENVVAAYMTLRSKMKSFKLLKEKNIRPRVPA